MPSLHLYFFQVLKLLVLALVFLPSQLVFLLICLHLYATLVKNFKNNHREWLLYVDNYLILESTYKMINNLMTKNENIQIEELCGMPAYALLQTCQNERVP